MSDMEYCGTICMAAHNLGIRLKRVDNDGKTGFIWRDIAAIAPLPGVWDEDPKAALKKACDILVDHIKVK
jgi:hypothetical protein